MDAQERLAWKILSDPLADERQWLAALKAASAKRKPSRDRLVWLGFGVACAAALLLSLGFVQLVDLGFDFGFAITEAVFGQPESAATAQGVTAFYALCYMAMPLFLGYSLGLEREHAGGNKRWSVALSLSVLCLYVLVSGVLETQRWSEICLTLPFLVILSASAYLSFRFGSFLYRELKLRTRPARLVAGGLFCYAPLAVVALARLAGVYEPYLVWQQEAAIYAGLIGLAAFVCARVSRPDSAAGAIVAALVATAPVLIANAVNVGANAVSLGLDNLGLGLGLGWRALFSACLITTVHLFATGSGSLIGYYLKSARRPHGG